MHVPFTQFAQRVKLYIMLLVAALLNSMIVQAQDTTATKQNKQAAEQRLLDDLSLEDLLNVEISVATGKGKALSQRESPSIITLITHEEIVNSGARDLTDVLRLVPGFEFGLDVQGVLGMSLRGNWAYEGKVLLLLDGLPMNDLLFGNVPVGNRIALSQIERIEIIRGPGSAIFGGFAAMAVINIITRDIKSLQLSAASSAPVRSSSSVLGSVMQNGTGRWGFDLLNAAQLGEVSASLGVYAQQGIRADGTFLSELDGRTYQMREYFTDNVLSYNLGVKGTGWSVRAFYEDARVGYAQTDTNGTMGLLDTRFSTFASDAQYTFTLSDNVRLTPRLSYTYQTPWANNDTFARRADFFYEKSASRLTGNLTLAAEPSREISITAGAEYFLDNGFVSDQAAEAGVSFAENSRSVSYSTISAFAQGIITSDIANLTLGARFDNHSRFGSAFAPRIGITKVLDRFHVKALWSRAFRAPTIENIDRNLSIKPEFVTVLEAELGYQFSSTVFATVNIFDIDVASPIVYFVSGSQGGYINSTRMGTRGLEAEVRWREQTFSLTSSYSFSVVNRNEVQLYTVPQTSAQMLGVPQHKIVVNASWDVSPDVSIHPSFVYLSERYAPVTSPRRTGLERSIEQFSPVGLLNLNIAWTPEIAGQRLITLSLAAMNLLNANYQYISPVENGNNPFAGAPREFVLRLSVR